jgi:DNA-binding transcriptional regulator YiaG
MRPLQPVQFVALPASADVNQASFARLSGVSTRQVNKWCRGRVALLMQSKTRWSTILAAWRLRHDIQFFQYLVRQC